jgi:hypothetical protein
MKNSNEEISITGTYINFPITLLTSTNVNNIADKCNSILNYACYEYSIRPELASLCIEKRIEAAAKYYCINYGLPSYEDGKDEYMRLNYLNANLIHPPKSGINVHMLFDFRDNVKSVFEIESFLGYCAIRSILQKQLCYLVTKKYVVARMAGFAKINDFKKAPINISKYLIRYHFNKLVGELTDKWGLKVFGNHTNGLYVSFALTPVQLGVHAEMNKKKNRSIIKANTKKEEAERINQQVKFLLKQ